MPFTRRTLGGPGARRLDPVAAKAETEAEVDPDQGREAVEEVERI